MGSCCFLRTKREHCRKETGSVTYKEARVYLDEVSKYGSVLGLDAVQNLLYELGNPQDALRFIHIAGTNGKGSVLAFTSGILSEAGFRTGRYISPTVISYLERIQVDGKWILEVEFAELVEEVRRAIVRMEAKGLTSPTVFEIETAIAFLYFQRKHCDVVVLETGLGGSLDATNIVKNTVVAAFTSISRDHMSYLGDTLEEIARNKAGIIKPGCIVVSAAQKPEVKKELELYAEKCGCRIRFSNPEEAVVLEQDYRGQTFSYRGMEHLQIKMAGSYQILNAVTAWEIIDAWNSIFEHQISEQAIRRGFVKAQWPGRFMCIKESPIFIIDGAHNVDAAKRLRESVELLFHGQRLVYIMGVFQDKEYEKMAEIMAPLAKCIYTVNLPDKNRTLPAEELKHAVEPYCRGPVYAVGDVSLAVEKALQEEEVILAFGSLSYLGQVIKKVKERK